MATPNIVPRANNEGTLGRSGLQWQEVRGQSIYQNGQQVANLASPALTGAPTAPTQASGDNSTKIATTAWVRSFLSSVANVLFSGAQTNGNLCTYNSGDGGLQDSGYSPANLLDRANHTGSQAQSSVTDLVADLATITGDIAANAAAIAGKASTSHTHVSADITDAASIATPDVLVKRGANGEVVGGQTAALGAAVEGQSDGALGVGVYGWNNSGANGVGGYFQSDGIAYPGAALIAEVNGTGTVPCINATHLNGGRFLECKTSAASPSIFWIDPSANFEWQVGAFTKQIAKGSATGNRVATLPDATGTVVLGDGSGITAATTFASAIGLGTGDNAQFASVQIAASTSDGVRFGASARLAMEDVADTTTWKLPSGGGATEKLVDGDGRGITDAAAFRTAIGAAGAGSPSFTGAVAINPSAGSTMFQLTGALGFDTNVVANSSGSVTITLPDGTGTLVLGEGTGITSASSFRVALGVTAIGDGLFTAASEAGARVVLGVGGVGDGVFTAATTSAARIVLGATSIGETLFTAATPSAARVAIKAAEAEEDAGYCFAYNDISTSSTTTTISSSSTWYDAAEGNSGMTYPDAVNFILPSRGAYIGAEYSGSVTRKFWVTITLSATAASANKSFQFGIGKNGALVSGTEVGRYISNTNEGAIAVEGLVSLANGDDITLMLQNRSDTTNATIENATICIRPLGIEN